MFSKTFTSETLGQIAVMSDSTDEGTPRINIFFKPEHLGTCSSGLIYKEDNGLIKTNCYPNGNSFHCSKGTYKDKNVSQVRLKPDDELSYGSTGQERIDDQVNLFKDYE